MPLWKHASLTLLLLSCSFAGDVRVQFDPARPEIGPFPSDFLTVEDSAQRTGRRVNLPLPDCRVAPSECGEISQINKLDGFNPNARITVSFSAPVNPDTLRDGLKYVWLDPVLPGRYNLGPAGLVTVINQPVWDPATNTAYAKPDIAMESGRRYLVVVTDAVRDLSGKAVVADEGFQGCLAKQLGGAYCEQLSDALTRAQASLGSAKVAGASIYTAMSASAWFEQVLPVVEQTPVNFARTGAVNSVSMADVQGLVLHEQKGADQFLDSPVPLTPALIAQFGFGKVAFGSFQSPRFITPEFYIPSIPTLSAPTPSATEEVFFHVWLPKLPAPASGYPVILAGHGFGDHSFGGPTAIGAANALGFAVVGMNAVGHGGGPKSTVRFFRGNGTMAEFPAPGRGVDLDGNGQIDDPEGCTVILPGNPVGWRDCIRQTAVDFLQLIHGIRTGIDLDGDGRPDLNSASINYFGQSLGGGYGAVLTAVSPDIAGSVLNVAVGTQTDNRLSPSRGLATSFLALRQPALLNKGDNFEDDLPLRYQDVKIRTTPGSAAIQDLFERIDWLEAVSSPVVLAPHMKQATLPGQPIKRVLFQMALGDQTVANPSTTALIHAAYLGNQVSLYRHDIARTIDPTLPANPHTYLIPLGSPIQSLVGFSALQQGFVFLASGLEAVPDANAQVRALLGVDLFETPVFLPER
ncbi:MAG TPA: Ig-like domain-containing protein [Paludibaculum sp.]|jgi:hypothetical protein